jgi:hypothetical protein
MFPLFIRPPVYVIQITFGQRFELSCVAVQRVDHWPADSLEGSTHSAIVQDDHANANGLLGQTRAHNPKSTCTAFYHGCCKVMGARDNASP